MKLLENILLDFGTYVQENPFTLEPKELYDPVNYILELGGKRLRPAVLLLSCHMFKGSYHEALPAAFAIEVFHNFTLLHDDIMDDAPLRRGRPTVHEKYSINAGILSGDVMLVQAYNSLLKLEGVNFMAIFEEFTKVAIEVCEGQQMDMDFEKSSSIAIASYLKMIELKTSVLVAGAMKIGAIIGGASESDAEAMYQFGKNIGIAFQLQDDLLDVYGDPVKFGKKSGGDIIQNKKTYLFLKALELATEQDRAELKSLYSGTDQDPSDKIDSVVQIFDRLQIKRYCEEVKEDYFRLAMSNLALISTSLENRKVMEAFAEALMSREV